MSKGNILADDQGLPIINTAWATQLSWVIDPVSGNDTRTGAGDTNNTSNALRTWGEFARRMRAVEGTRAQIVHVYILSTLNAGDVFDLDFDIYSELHVWGSTAVVRSGSITSAFSARTGTQPNKIIDSAVSSWTADIGKDSGRILAITSGNANGRYSFVMKDLGSHQASMSTFTRIEDLTETNPANGDTYQILSMPFIQDYRIKPKSGTAFLKFLNIGDANSTYYDVAPDGSGGAVQFTYCSLYWLYQSNCTTYLANSCLKNTPSLFNGTIELFGGYVGDILGQPLTNEIETAGELYCDLGVVFQGVGMNIINDGYARLVDCLTMDSPQSAWIVGTYGKIRITKAGGSGNAGWGLLVSNSGEAVVADYSQATVTGVSGDTSLAGVTKSWATLQAAGYTKSATSRASIGPV